MRKRRGKPRNHIHIAVLFLYQVRISQILGALKFVQDGHYGTANFEAIKDLKAVVEYVQKAGVFVQAGDVPSFTEEEKKVRGKGQQDVIYEQIYALLVAEETAPDMVSDAEIVQLLAKHKARDLFLYGGAIFKNIKAIRRALHGLDIVLSIEKG